MAFFKMGVAVDIKNHQFRFGKKVSAEFNEDKTESTNNVSYANGTSNINLIIGAGDKLILGPSTHSDNVGAKQEVTISSINTTTMTFEENLTYSFSSGDPITGTGTYFPDAWSIGTSENISLTTYNLHRLHNTNETDSDYGVDDMYAFKLRHKRSIGGYSEVIFKYDISSGELLPSTYYRLGFFYKIDWKVTTQLDFRLYVGDIGRTNVLVTIPSITSTNKSGTVSSWTEVNAVTSSTISSQTTLDTLDLFLQSRNYSFANDADYNTFWLDSFYLEHAKGTDGATSGVYTFTEYPNRGSQSWNKNKSERSNTLIDGAEKRYNIQGIRTNKWQFSCDFENVDSSFLYQLRILEAWQDAGYKLVFHTNESATSGHPPVMVGYMDLPSDDQLLWHLGKVSFPMTFVEAR